ncbi:uncharacterized protein SCDLUD_001494 [Saccharomycodes ludwigii]|uniref:uncharacterized protein n=1 Tax=Saccharomycodes ludwigii TaxID=36035 RepID=UPI001E863D8E|nr:hypothetical protein SCDLUD_001494 [Saccharomycodes ludwigii]KAH3901721.1 hypothetical protein SCDLUD_001494 [Saccharomycodes ludwigii]
MSRANTNTDKVYDIIDKEELAKVRKLGYYDTIKYLNRFNLPIKLTDEELKNLTSIDKEARKRKLDSELSSFAQKIRQKRKKTTNKQYHTFLETFSNKRKYSQNKLNTKHSNGTDANTNINNYSLRPSIDVSPETFTHLLLRAPRVSTEQFEQMDSSELTEYFNNRRNKDSLEIFLKYNQRKPQQSQQHQEKSMQ